MLKSLITRAKRIAKRSVYTPPRSWHPSWLPRTFLLRSEAKVHLHVAEENSHLFLAYNAETTEIEVLNWLHATICLLKPHNILETGSADGIGALALGSACKNNGFGKVYSVEIDPERCKRLERLLKNNALKEYGQVVQCDSITFLRRTEIRFDFAFFDSVCELAAREYAICIERDILQGVAVFHDTSPLRTLSLKGWPSEAEHNSFRADLLCAAQSQNVSGYFESTLSRGLFAIFPKGHSLF
jgi:predicted O-methyltransferase YrrM